MKFVATCATCGKPLKSVHLTLPVVLPSPVHAQTPTLSNCGKCGARGAYIAEVREATQDVT